MNNKHMAVRNYSVYGKTGKLVFKRFPVSSEMSKQYIIKQGYTLKKPIKGRAK